MPLSGVPAGQEETGGMNLGVLGEARSDMSRETGLGVGERGLEKGWTAPVEVDTG
jgi:hypothetical protein